jgi:hypothetical protein
MEKFLEGSVLASADLGTAFTDGYQFGFRRSAAAVMALKVLSPSFAQQLGAGAVFLLLNLLHLRRHSRGQGDRRGCQWLAR